MQHGYECAGRKGVMNGVLLGPESILGRAWDAKRMCIYVGGPKNKDEKEICDGNGAMHGKEAE